VEIKHIDFLEILLEKRELYPFYEKVVNTISQKTIYNKENNGAQAETYNTIYFINDVPNYLNAEIPTANKKIKSSKVLRYEGFIINLKKYKDIGEYLNSNFSSKSRSKFRTYQKRLEMCFNIKYKMYCGDISKEHYNYLFDEFREILKRRFQQKQAVNEDLKRWDYYHKLAYPMILEKKASLFVIYDREKPINICLNFIYDKIIFGYIRTFDIDYSKFNIGFIDMIEQVNWCLQNDIEIFDLLKGDFDYKRRWADSIYNYETHIIYNPQFFNTKKAAVIKTFKIKKYYQLLHLFKKWNLHLLYRKFKIYKYNKSKSEDNDRPGAQIVIDNKPDIPLDEKLLPVNLDNPEYVFLKKPVYDFLYSCSEPLSSICISKFNSNYNSYLIEGKKSIQKITINNT